MAKPERPEDKYWQANGVFPGATTGYFDAAELIIPEYLVVGVPPGFRGLMKGQWSVIAGSLIQNPSIARADFEAAAVGTGRGDWAAVALVAITGHPDPGDDYGILVTVLDVAANRSVVPAGYTDPLPGLKTIRDVAVAAYRRVRGLNPDDYVRAEPVVNQHAADMMRENWPAGYPDPAHDPNEHQ